MTYDLKICTLDTTDPQIKSSTEDSLSDEVKKTTKILKQNPLFLSDNSSFQYPQNKALVVVNQELSTSIKKEEFDEEFRAKYFVPPSTHDLWIFLGDFQAQGDYQGTSLGRKKMLKNLNISTKPEQLCDILCLEKKEQAQYPSFLPNRLVSWFENRQQEKILNKQKEITQIIVNILEDKLKIWTYESFMVCGDAALLDLGYSSKDAQKLHIVALFYKQKQS